MSIPDPLLENWLLDTGSLTERLQANCRHFRVEVLCHDVFALFASENHYLYEQFSEAIQPTQVREVLLLADGMPWVFARSLMPLPFIQEGMSKLGELGNKPLGKIIFNDHRFKRQGFELLQIPKNATLPQKLNITSKHSLWGRRSLFCYEQYRLSVAEVFLPDSPAYNNLSPHQMRSNE